MCVCVFLTNDVLNVSLSLMKWQSTERTEIGLQSGSLQIGLRSACKVPDIKPILF
jgi:hypothetical protein